MLSPLHLKPRAERPGRPGGCGLRHPSVGLRVRGEKPTGSQVIHLSTPHPVPNPDVELRLCSRAVFPTPVHPCPGVARVPVLELTVRNNMQILPGGRNQFAEWIIAGEPGEHRNSSNRWLRWQGSCLHSPHKSASASRAGVAVGRWWRQWRGMGLRNSLGLGLDRPSSVGPGGGGVRAGIGPSTGRPHLFRLLPDPTQAHPPFLRVPSACLILTQLAALCGRELGEGAGRCGFSTFHLHPSGAQQGLRWGELSRAWVCATLGHTLSKGHWESSMTPPGRESELGARRRVEGESSGVKD